MALNASLPSEFRTLRVYAAGKVIHAVIDRPEARNAINGELVEDFERLLDMCREEAQVLVIQGHREHFCFGADFQAISETNGTAPGHEDALYRLWLDMRRAGFIVVSQVKGAANAGGIGFVAASDIVLAAPSASFGLSELLFGLYPACVLPFLVQRVGAQHAHFLTLSTKPVPAAEALRMGLVDVCADDVDVELKRLLFRLERVPKAAIRDYKAYMATLLPDLGAQQVRAVAANRAMFASPAVREGIERYVRTGAFPWQS
jgi:polyketide biosynthesis enoyl-CoA hydratase PksH